MKYVYQIIGLLVLFLIAITFHRGCSDKYWAKIIPIEPSTSVNLEVKRYFIDHGAISFNDSLGLFSPTLDRIDTNRFHDEGWFELDPPFHVFKAAYSDTIVITYKRNKRVYVYTEDYLARYYLTNDTIN